MNQIMKKRKILKFCNLFLMLFLYLPIQAQEEVKITGNITAVEDGEPLPGVTVVVKGTTNGTTTDFDGNYSIITEPNAILVFTFLGFERKEEIVGGRSIINVGMTEDVSQLSEVVVVGYGTQNKRDVTGAMAQIDAEKLSEIPVPSVAQQLQGRLAGVQINENSGEPGGAMTFRIRGAASINAGNSPLIVIDGFPTTSGLEALSPNEIESISVLKDASASSLYGSRAANGVILITTKQAKQGQKSIEFSSYVGVQSVSERGRPDLMNAREFAQFKKEYYEDAAIYEGYTGGP